MIVRLLLTGCLAVLGLRAQLRLFVVQGDSERAVEAQFDLGTMAAGDVQQTQFRVRNVSGTLALVSTVSLSGAAFAIAAAPSVPQTLAPGEAISFTVRFQPTGFGSFSANLRVETVFVILRGVAQAAPALFVEENGLYRLLNSASTLDFGKVERGNSGLLRVTLENQTGQKLSITRAAISGPFFRIVTMIPEITTAAPGEVLAFEIAFEPAAVGTYQGILKVDQRLISLRGTGVEPALPKPEIALTIEAPKSAQQGSLSIQLASASRTNGTGQIQLEFVPSVTGASRDPVIVFPATGTQTAPFTVSEADRVARFEGRPAIDFQTGTTAGTLTFTVKLSTFEEHVSLVIAPALIEIDTTRAVRAASGVEVRINAYDNTRSVSKLSFSFFDRNGRSVEPAVVQVDASAEFRRYFETSDLGGIFGFRAIFPVTGAQEQIEAVQIEMTNSVGTTRTEKIRFLN